MADDRTTSDTVIEIDGVTVQARADPHVLGVWAFYRNDLLIGTISDAHTYLRGAFAGYIVHRVDHTSPSLVSTWTDSIRFLLSNS